MTISVYQKGDLARATGVFTDTNGDPVDPTGLTFTMTSPSGIVTAYVYGTDAALVQSVAGTYYVDVNLNESGDWRYQWVATGNGQTVGDGQWIVEPSYF